MKAKKITLIVLIFTCVSCLVFSDGAQACWTLPGYQYGCRGWICCDDPSCDITVNPAMKCAFNWYCLFVPIDSDCCPLRTALNNNETKLGVLRETRDLRMARTALGRSLIKLYYKHSLEITSILLSDEELLSIVTPVVNEIVEKAVAFNNHEKVSVDNALIEDISAAADLINEKASPELKTAIKRVKKQIKTGYIFRNFGITVND